jgi:hypothetical protein
MTSRKSWRGGVVQRAAFVSSSSFGGTRCLANGFHGLTGGPMKIGTAWLH